MLDPYKQKVFKSGAILFNLPHYHHPFSLSLSLPLSLSFFLSHHRSFFLLIRTDSSTAIVKPLHANTWRDSSEDEPPHTFPNPWTVAIGTAHTSSPLHVILTTFKLLPQYCMLY